MCQQWLSIFGLLADIAGFLLIATEWYRAFSHSVFVRNRELHDAYERNRLREEGEGEPDEVGLAEEEEVMAKEFSKLHNAEAGFRKWLFVFGSGLVILGFVLQGMGSWPGSDPIFGLRSC